MLLLEAFNKDRASLPQPMQPAATLPPPDPRTQEMINEKLKKAEEFGKGISSDLISLSLYVVMLKFLEGSLILRLLFFFSFRGTRNGR